MNAPMSAVTFSATSLKVDLSMDARMGRKMIGLFGAGGLQIRQDGLSFEARRHHYGANLIGGGVLAVVVLVLVFAAGDPSARASGMGFGMFAFIIGAWLTSIAGRFRKPETIHLDPRSIERVYFNAVLICVCTRDGDVQLSTDQATYGYLLQTLQGWGVPPTRL